MKRQELIKELKKRHPAYGVERKWSEYTGGMKDTGRWFTGVMLDAPVEDLQQLLDQIIAEENASIDIPEPCGMLELSMGGKKYYACQSEVELMKGFNGQLHQEIFFKKPT